MNLGATVGWRIPHAGKRLGLLDPWKTGLWGAYGRVLLRGNYFGPYIRLYRSTDGAEMDFGYADPHQSYAPMDWAAMIAWLGVAIGYVKVWYDQSGAGNDIHRTVAIPTADVSIDTSLRAVQFAGSAQITLDSINPSGSPNSIATVLAIQEFTPESTGTFYQLGSQVFPVTKGGYLEFNPNNPTLNTKMEDTGGAAVYGFQFQNIPVRNIFHVLAARWKRRTVSPVTSQSVRVTVDSVQQTPGIPYGPSTLDTNFDPETWHLGPKNAGTLEQKAQMFAIWEEGLAADTDMDACTAAVYSGS